MTENRNDIVHLKIDEHTSKNKIYIVFNCLLSILYSLLLFTLTKKKKKKHKIGSQKKH